MRKTATVFLVVVVAADLALLLSGWRVLVWESRNQVPDHFERLFKNRPDATREELRCHYFTGRSVRVSAALSEAPGTPDECPFMTNPQTGRR